MDIAQTGQRPLEPRFLRWYDAAVMEEEARLVERVAEVFGHSFKNPSLAVDAVTHRSYLHENPMAGSDNERLEFLGDAVLNLAVAEILVSRMSEAAEGRLTKLRAALVNEAALSQAARSLGLGEILRLGRGEESTGGRDKESILANTFEALIGAVFLDVGYTRTKRVIHRHLSSLLAGKIEEDDAKSKLQEILQAHRLKPRYRVAGERGPDHAKEFEVELTFDTDDRPYMGRGVGRSKKEAEQDAAKAALGFLLKGR